VDIDSIDPSKPAPPTPPPVVQPEGATTPPATKPPTASRSKSRWVFLNGQWTKDVTPAAPATPGQAAAPDPLAGQPLAKDLLTQRVIEVPVRPLLAGQSDANIVIRPGDVVRVPTAPTGVVYVAGQVARPGTFTLPPSGKLTLLRAIDAAGGLSQLGVPERVDLTRMVGTNREATIRLNMRAIAEKTQPDVILKADDRVNVGTDFWAFPIAIIRNGFRVNYGFGFLIDRNFGNDIFGPPPESQGF
jgi:polysaccharide biosynthesis/export protein